MPPRSILRVQPVRASRRLAHALELSGARNGPADLARQRRQRPVLHLRAYDPRAQSVVVLDADEIAGSPHAYAEAVAQRLDHAAGGTLPDFHALVFRNGLRRFSARRRASRFFRAQAQPFHRAPEPFRRRCLRDDFASEFPQRLVIFAQG